ncbi:class I adenylate-forming enzyme family protein [Gordonia phthalatica]|uniref:O-succinylbenzoate--CoA ligase n=1 Tax=Gordonia phthalatica TaxID=1136941 RepID=A0A0N9NFA9_9ACTN|nr:long-chain fatty acid--CoA ligase [Gordonia phthalatica]ALG83965.1 O-succinylbenzoate--CoA ligase [Gordonia phthalatica]
MPTIGSTLRLSANRVPERTALIFGDVRYTYRELDQAADRLAGWLAEQGLRKGDRLAMFSPSSDRFVVTMYAAHRIGAIFVPINPASSAPELDYILRDSGSTFLTFAPALSPVVDAASKNGLPDDLQLLALGPVDGHRDLFALVADRPATPIDDTVTESDNAHILYTSGTTGKPKGALFDHRRVMSTALAVITTCGIKDADRLLHVAPLYHAAELCILLIPGTLVGATHVVHAGFDPVKVLDNLEAERITMFFGVPTMFQFLLRLPDLGERDLSAWRTGLFGAAPMPPHAVEQLVTTLPNVNFIQLAGQTEAGPSGIFCDRDQVRERPDASGRQAVVLTEVRIVDPDGNDIAAGSTGEMLLRGETIMKEYWNKPEATADTIVDGWLHTGDICRLDEDGYITIVDRLKDMIITGGRNVYSIEVEGAVAAHPNVVDAAVVGRPHEEFGESIVAFVTLVDGATLDLDEVRAFVGERISHYKLPHEFIVVESIPRNPSGKILKRDLRESLAYVTR